MTELILLGAGASAEANIPTAYEMTAKILELFESSPRFETHARIVSFVIGGLLFEKGIKGESPLSCGINIEELFNAVDLLSQRHTLEAAPFVGSWHSMVEEFDRITPPRADLRRLHQTIYQSVTSQLLDALQTSPPAFGHNDIDRKLEQIIRRAVDAATRSRSVNIGASESIGREIRDYVSEWVRRWLHKLQGSRPSSHEFEYELGRALDRQSKPAEGRVFDDVKEEMIRRLVDLVWIEKSADPARLRHLAPIFNRASSGERLVVATLNYDNVIELLSETLNIPCHVGIERWSKEGVFDFSGQGVQLLKLHGSIDWALTRYEQEVERPLPHSHVGRIERTDVSKGAFRPAVVFGHRNKLTVEGPFLDLLRSFREELFKSELLTAVGYSFGDAHINEYISQWLNQSSTHKLQIVNRSFQRNQNPYATLLKRLHAKEPTRVHVVEKPAGEGLIELYGSPNPI